MDKKELKDLSREELVDVVYGLVNEGNKAVRKPTPRAVAKERARLRHRALVRRRIFTGLGILVVVAALAVLVSTYLFTVIQVSGDSMEPTLKDGDVLVLVNGATKKQGELCCIAWQNKLLIKRVIAGEGQTVAMDDYGNVYVDGKYLDEPYLKVKSLGECDCIFPYTVPEGKIFVMGDMRDTSIDSRNSAVGCIGKDQIVGRVFFKIWSAKEKK